MSEPTFNNILFEESEGIATLSINRPKSLNALDAATLKEISAALDIVKDNPDRIKALIITGTGEKAFVAGADIAAMHNLNAIEARELSRLAHEAFGKIERLQQITIAAVNGYALGGGTELASSCDIRYASTKAKFGQPEVTLGVIPGFGGTQRLTRLVGRGKAKEMIASGAMIDAKEAYRIGLAEEIAEPDELMAKTRELAKKIMANGPIAVGMAKYVIDRGADLPLNLAIDFETQLWGETFATEDQTEGMNAFLEKRKAAFTGK